MEILNQDSFKYVNLDILSYILHYLPHNSKYHLVSKFWNEAYKLCKIRYKILLYCNKFSKRIKPAYIVDISNCPFIKYFPPGVNNFKIVRAVSSKSVKFLESFTGIIEGNFSDTVIKDLTPIKNVQMLDISNCEKILDISMLKNIQYLNITYTLISDLSPLAKLLKPGNIILKTLVMNHCYNIVDITPIRGINTIQLIDCPKVTNIEALDKTSYISHGNDDGMVETILDLSCLTSVISLTCFHFERCLIKLPHTTTLTSLRTNAISFRNNNVSDCYVNLKKLQYINPLDIQGHLDNFTNLQYLDISYSNITDIPELPLLTTLIIDNCAYVKDISYFTKLIYLNINDCVRLDRVNYMPNLQTIIMKSGTFRIKVSNSHNQLNDLFNIYLSCFANVTNFTLTFSRIITLIHLPNIKRLKLSYNENLISITNLNTKKLKLLDISGCINLNKFVPDDKPNKKFSIRKLILTNCYHILNFNWFTNIYDLNLSACTQLTNLDFLETEFSLVNLTLNRCTSLTNLKSLNNLINYGRLSYLNLSECTQLHNLDFLTPNSQIKNRSGLFSLNVNHCVNLTTLQHLNSDHLLYESESDKLTKLHNLTILGCTKLINLKGTGSVVELRVDNPENWQREDESQ